MVKVARSLAQIFGGGNAPDIVVAQTASLCYLAIAIDANRIQECLIVLLTNRLLFQTGVNIL